jgi:hypothetical protein
LGQFRCSYFVPDIRVNGTIFGPAMTAINPILVRPLARILRKYLTQSGGGKLSFLR